MVVSNLIKSLELNSIVRQYICRQTLQHQQNLGTTTNIRVDSDWKNRLVILPINEVELIPSHLLNVPGIGEAVAVRSVLDEHHWR